MNGPIRAQGYKIIFNAKSSDVVTITSINDQTGETFVGEDIALHKINIQTLQTAFKQSSQVKYAFKRSEKTFEIEISVQLDYLPKFSEIITLSLVQGQSSRQKILLAEVRQDLVFMENRIEYLTDLRTHFTKEIQYASTGNQIFSQKLPKGKYLLSVGGNANYYFSGQYEAQCDEEGNYSNYRGHPILITVISYEGNNLLEKQDYTLSIHSRDDIEYPFAMTSCIKVGQDGKVALAMKSKGQQQFNLTNIIISISPAI